MSTLCKTYSSEIVARRAVSALLKAGVPERDVRLLTGCRRHDVRKETVGNFAGAVDPNAPVGKFAGRPRLRRQGAGTFAGDPDRRRQGSFADADSDTIATYEQHKEHPHVTGDPDVRRLLRHAGVAPDTIRRVVDDLHTGHAVVLAEIAEVTPSDARARLEDVAA